MTRPDKDYERFVQNVYQTILTAEGRDTIKVEHNFHVEGRSGHRHQLDVYWEYKQGGVIYQTAVECKFYKSAISIGKVRDFSGVLHDVPNLRGLMATTKGYQAGAVKLAKSEGIELLVIRSPENSDYEWHQLNVKVSAPYAKILWHSLSIVPDLDWCKSKGIGPEELKIKGSGSREEVVLENRQTQERKTLYEIERKLSISAQNLTVGRRYLQVLPDEDKPFEDAWLHFPKEVFADSIKVQQIHVPYVVEVGDWTFQLVQVTEHNRFVIKDVLKDEHTFYDERGKPRGGKFHY